MMKIAYMKKIIALLLCMASVLSLLAGCGGEKASGASTGRNVTINNVSDFSVEGTTHIFNISNADGYLAKGGKSEYCVVIGKESDSRIQSAAKDFVNFFLEATEVYLPTAYAEEVGYTKDSKYIVIGENAASQVAGVKPDKALLGAHGFQIQTIDNSIFVFGAQNEGSQYGTYELLTQLFQTRRMFQKSEQRAQELSEELEAMRMRRSELEKAQLSMQHRNAEMFGVCQIIAKHQSELGVLLGRLSALLSDGQQG